MPTAYTAAVVDGTLTDFRTFALQCARQFGACVMQRDDPIGDLPKHRSVSSYYADAVARAEARVQQLANMDEEDKALAAEAAHTKDLATRTAAEEATAVARERCEAMLARVDAWEPPTAEHVNLRDFMRQQLRETIRFDGASAYNNVLERVPLPDWHSLEMERAVRALDRARNALRDEEKRVRDANAWIDALYGSLPAA